MMVGEPTTCSILIGTYAWLKGVELFFQELYGKGVRYIAYHILVAEVLADSVLALIFQSLKSCIEPTLSEILVAEYVQTTT